MKRASGRAGRMRQRQTGVLVFITPIILLLIVMFGALMLDGARLYSIRETMQAQVNAAATAAANFTQSCNSIDRPDVDDASMLGIVENTASDMKWDGKGHFDVLSGLISSKKDPVSSEYIRQFQKTGPLSANAVAVRYQRVEPISALLPWLGDITLTTQAAAKKEVIATISASTSTLNVGGGDDHPTVINSLLGFLFNGGKPYDFDADQLDQISDVTVRLGDLLDESGIGGVVNALPVNAYELAENLKKVVDPESSQVTPISKLVDGILNNVNLKGISVESILKVTGDGASIPKEAKIPVYGLLTSMVMNALKGTTKDLEGISLDVPGLISTDLSIKINSAPAVVIAPARMAVGSDSKWLGHLETADITIVATPRIHPNLTIARTGVSLDLSLPLTIKTGTAKVDLVSAECATGNVNEVRFGLEGATGLASIEGKASLDVTLSILGNDIPIKSGEISVSSGPLGGGPIYASTDSISLDKSLPDKDRRYSKDVQGGLSLAGAHLTISVPDKPPETDEPKDCGLLSLGCLLNNLVNGLTKHVINDILSGFLSQLEGALKGGVPGYPGPGILESILENVVNPVLSGLGVGLGTATITVSDPEQGPVVLIQNVKVDGW